MKVFLTSLFFFFNFLASAQQDHFIYLQTENKQPFFVKFKDKTFTASPLGYVIIANLQDGIYSLIVGFPQSTSQQEFNCVINNKDVGFIIKSAAENQWQLQNVESLAIIVPGEVRTKIITDTLQKETDPFSTMLANAVNDSTILQKDIVKEVIPEKITDVAQKDSSQIAVPKNEVAIVTHPAAGKKKIKIKKITPASQHPFAVKKPPTEIIANASDNLNSGNKDTTQVLAMNTDNTVSKPTDSVSHKDEVKEPLLTNINNAVASAAIDSLNKKDTVTTNTVVKPAELLQKDSVQDVINNASIQKDSLQKIAADIDTKPSTKKKVKSKTKNNNPENSVIEENEATVIKSDNKIDSLNTSIAANVPLATATKLKIKKKKNVQASDSTISNNAEKANNDLSNLPSKEKIKRKKKGEIQDTLIAKSDVSKAEDLATIKQQEKTKPPPFINFDDNASVPLSVIKRRSKRNTKQGLEMLYVDIDGDTRDTITILIPADKKAKEENKVEIATETSQVTESDLLKSKIINTEKKDETIKEPVVKATMINSDCKSLATDEDFLKIRKKMVAENNDEDMIKVAKKVFKTKCFTTEQVKNLSVLFLKDEAKYMFFDAAYPYVSDTELFTTLQGQLSDEYYITRFRAMIHK